MKFLLGFFICTLGIVQSMRASDASYLHSWSSSSISDKIKVSTTFEKSHKISASYKIGRDTSGAADDKSSQLKLSYKYKFSSRSSLGFDYKNSDESYYFEGQMFAAKTTFPIFTYIVDKKNILITSLNLSIEGGQKKYSKIKNETYVQRQFSIGIDQEFSQYFTGGIDYSTYSYSASSSATLTKQALDNITISNSDITNQIAALTKSNYSIYFEYSYQPMTFGINYSVDTAFIGNAKTTTTELYADYQFAPDWSVNGSYSSGKAEDSTSTTQTYSLGLNYFF